MGKNGAGRATLSRREQEVAALVAEGLTNRAIAERLFISERTVDGHLEHVREKLGVTSRAQVAAWYVAQPPAGAAAAAGAPSAPRRIRRSFDVLLVVASVIVLALVGGLVVPRLLAPATPSGPRLTSFTPAAQPPFNRPQSVAVGADGLIYVADTDNYAIRKFDPKRQAITPVAGGKSEGDFVDGGDALQTPIEKPTGVAVGPDGIVFFANGDFVGKVATDSTVHLVVAKPLVEPVAVALGPEGALYIADRTANRIWRLSTSGAITVVAGSGGDPGFGGDNGSALDAQLNHPVAVAIDPAGDIYIADQGNNRIRRVDAQTDVITTIAGSSDIYGFAGDGKPGDQALLSLPSGVAVAPNGDVYISDTGNDRVRKVGRDARITTVVGAAGELYGPSGLTISPAGDLYIADIGDSKVDGVRGVAAR